MKNRLTQTPSLRKNQKLKNTLFIGSGLLAITVAALLLTTENTTPRTTYYWVGTYGGNGNWDDPKSWRIGSVNGEIPLQSPLTTQDVRFTQEAFDQAALGNEVGEVGNISISSNWATISLQREYENPIVVLGSPGYNEADRGAARIRNIDAVSFEARFEEWDCADGGHVQENIPYMVVERGSYTLANGTQLIAGSVEGVTSSTVSTILPHTFNARPAILATVVSANEPNAVTPRVAYNTAQNRLDIRLQDVDYNHVEEEVHYVAFESGSNMGIGAMTFESGVTTRKINHGWRQIDFQQTYGENRVAFTYLNSIYGGDLANLRVKEITDQNLKVKIDETLCDDNELAHTTEEVGYMIFNEAGAISSIAVKPVVNIPTLAYCYDFIVDSTLTSYLSFTGNGNLDIFGDFRLAESVTFSFSGNIGFRATEAADIDSKGVPFNGRLIFEGPNGTFHLKDSLHTVYNLTRGMILHHDGALHTHGYKLSAHGFTANSQFEGKALDLDTSHVYLYSHNNDWDKRAWHVNYNDGDRGTIDADKATFHFKQINPNSNNESFAFLGFNSAYGDLLFYQRAWIGGEYLSMGLLRHEGSVRGNYLGSQVGLLDLKAGNTYKFRQHGNNSRYTTIDSIRLRDNNCSKYTYFRSYRDDYNAYLIFNTPPIELENIRVYRIHHLSNTVTLVNSIDEGNTSGWSYATPDPKDYYWVNGPGNWRDPAHWRIGSLTGNTAACAPLMSDNIFFMDGCGLTSGNAVVVDSASFAGSMYWDSTLPAGIHINGNSSLTVKGEVTFGRDMIIQPTVVLFGEYNDTIPFNGSEFAKDLRLRNDTLTIAEDLTVGGRLILEKVVLNTSEVNITTPQLFISGLYATSHWYPNGTHLTLSSSDPFYCINNYFQTYPSGDARMILSRADDGIRFPTINRSHSFPTVEIIASDAQVYAHGAAKNIHVKGDIIGRSSINFSGIEGKLITVDSSLYMYGGKSFRFPGGDTEQLIIGDSLISLASGCSDKTTFTGGAFGTRLTVDHVDLKNCQVAYMDAANAMVAADAIDGGNNSNISFTAYTPKTFYWRANKDDPQNFSGDITDSDHWTIDPNRTTGEGDCTPAPLDSVVFDDMSIGTARTAITFDNYFAVGAVYMNFAENSPGMEWKGNQAMDVKGSLTLDKNLLYTYTGEFKLLSDKPTSFITTEGLAINSVIRILGNAIYELQDDFYSRRDLHVNRGGLHSKGFSLNVLSFRSQGTETRDIDIRNSSLTSRGGGTNTFRIDQTNLSWESEGSEIFLQSNDADFIPPAAASFKKVIATGQKVLIRRDSLQIGYLEMNGHGDFYHNIFVDSVKMVYGHTYNIWPGKTIHLANEHGNLIAVGSQGNYINIYSQTRGSKAYIRKDEGAIICTDYLRMRDIDALSSNGIVFETSTTSENLENSCGGQWDFTKPPFQLPEVEVFGEKRICIGDDLSIPLILSGSGPFFVDYTLNGMAFRDTLPDYAGTHELLIDTEESTELTITGIQAISCDKIILGNVLARREYSLWVNPIGTLPTINTLGSCNLRNLNRWVRIFDDNNDPILEIKDDPLMDLISLGETEVKLTREDGPVDVHKFHHMARVWEINPENDGPARVRLYFTPQEFEDLKNAYDENLDITLNDLLVVRYPENLYETPINLPLIQTGTIPQGSFTTEEVHFVEFETPGFSYFTITVNDGTNSPLPVSLLSFIAKTDPLGNVKIDWVVEQELNMQGYNLLHSNDGDTWQTLRNIAANNVPDKQVYTYIHRNTGKGIHYYKLVMIDLDGSEDYSSVISTNIQKNQGNLQAYYTNGTVMVNFPSDQLPEQGVIRVLSINGQVIRTAPILAGKRTYQLDVQNLSSGTYVISLAGASYPFPAKKFIKP